VFVELPAGLRPPEPCPPAEIRELVHGGLNESDACETVLAMAARMEAAVECELGDGLAALTVGDRLISLGFSCLRDYAREVLDVEERTAEVWAHLSRELRSRPLLRAAVRAGDVRQRNALAVLPVAKGEAEASWVARARDETVRALTAAVRAARGTDEAEGAWTLFHVSLSPEDRAAVDGALDLAGKLLPGSKRPQRLEAMAQEYLGEHPRGAGEDATRLSGSFRRETDLVERLEARLEEETLRWSYLEEVLGVRAPETGWFDEVRSATEIDERLRALAEKRASWDALLGYCAYVVKRARLFSLAGFASFAHYCQERLGLAPRTVELRAASEGRLWRLPALRAARDGGLAYEKVRLLSRLPAPELPAWIERARTMTVAALRDALAHREEAQMCAAKVLRARVPADVAELLAAAFRAVREVEGRHLDDGRCLVRVARHFLETYGAALKKARTRSQKVRERDLGRCRAPGCSRRAVHAHHIIPRSQGGTDDDWNLVALCGCHHLRGIHGGYIRVSGRAPGALVWEVRGRIWADGRFGGGPADAAA
jgi:hypothetical protein